MRRRTQASLLAIAAVVLAVVAAGLLTGRGKGGATAAPAAPVPTTTTTALPSTTTTPAPAPGFEAADPVGAGVDLFAAPGDATPTGRLSNPTPEKVPLALAVVDHDTTPGWLLVQIPRRPNGSTAWVRADQVTRREVPNRIEVSVAAKQLRVYEGRSAKVLFSAPVATGTARTPTPLGHFYVDVIVDLITKNGPYGAFQISVAGFSDVLRSFAGGQGQIAIHGTNQPELIGQDVSNGCVRMRNPDITALVDLVSTGTPVDIVA